MQTRYAEYRRGARVRNLSFELTIDDFKKIVIQNCFYCGEIPRSAKRNFQTFWVPMNGIDRVDNNRGYRLDNVVPCCTICNTLKKTMSMTDFLNHIAKISNKLNIG